MNINLLVYTLKRFCVIVVLYRPNVYYQIVLPEDCTIKLLRAPGFEMANFYIAFYRVLSLFVPDNNILQAESTDLSTGITLVAACVENVHNLRTK